MTEEKKDLEQEIELAKKENPDGVITVKFRKPVEYEGKTFEEMTFDFEKLTGRDSLAIEGELTALGKPLVIPALSGEYLVRMAAKASNERIGIDFFNDLGLRDFNRIRSAARSFLLASE